MHTCLHAYRKREGAVSYPDDEHGALDFVGGGPHKLGGDSVHGVVQHADGGHQLGVCTYTQTH